MITSEQHSILMRDTLWKKNRHYLMEGQVSDKTTQECLEVRMAISKLGKSPGEMGRHTKRKEKGYLTCKHNPVVLEMRMACLKNCRVSCLTKAEAEWDIRSSAKTPHKYCTHALGDHSVL